MTVMDESDPSITFDEEGISNVYWDFHKKIKPYWNPNGYGKKVLEKKINKIKNYGKKKEFDCNK